MEYLAHLLVLIGIYTILTISVNLLTGIAGQISLSQGAFLGVGAYIYAILSTQYGFSFAACLLAVVLISGVLGLIIAFLAIRQSKSTFPLVTFGFQIIMMLLINNLDSITNGSKGIYGIPEILPRSWEYHQFNFAIIVWLSVLVLLLFQVRVKQTQFGRILMTLRESEVEAVVTGKNTNHAKISVFVISSIIASFSGILYAAYISYIDPTAFSFNESILVITCMIIGGSGTVLGPLIGTALILLLPETLRLFNIQEVGFANLRQIIYGVLLIVFIRLKPRGLLNGFSNEDTN